MRGDPYKKATDCYRLHTKLRGHPYNKATAIGYDVKAKGDQYNKATAIGYRVCARKRSVKLVSRVPRFFWQIKASVRGRRRGKTPSAVEGWTGVVTADQRVWPLLMIAATDRKTIHSQRTTNAVLQTAMSV